MVIKIISSHIIFLMVLCQTVILSQSTGLFYFYDNLNRIERIEYPNGDVISYTYDAVGNRTSTIVNADGIISINVKAFLEGPFTSNQVMSTTLKESGSIPLSQPYNSEPWNYNGTESVTSIPANVVDWVLVELRTGTEAITMVKQRAAFIKNDGWIVDTDGTSDLSFPGVLAGDYYIVVYHRNHLSIMSSSAQSLNTGQTSNQKTNNKITKQKKLKLKQKIKIKNTEEKINSKKEYIKNKSKRKGIMNLEF